MGRNKKRAVKLQKTVGGSGWDKNVHFWRDPLTLNSTWRPNEEFLKKQRYLNSVLDGENRTKIGQAMPEKRCRVCTHPRTCARRLSFTGDFST